jgi:uncharacterized membrane protein
MWLNHHTIFNHVVRVDRPLLFLNLLLLMIVAIVPFPTALISEALNPHAADFHAGDRKVATVFYGIVMICMSIGFSTVWGYLVRHPRLLDEALHEHIVRESLPRFGLGFLAYFAATGVALFQPVVALFLFGVIAIYYAFEHLPSPAPELSG